MAKPKKNKEENTAKTTGTASTPKVKKEIPAGTKKVVIIGTNVGALRSNKRYIMHPNKARIFVDKGFAIYE